MGELKIYGRTKTVAKKKVIDKSQSNLEKPLKRSKLKKNNYEIVRRRVAELTVF